MVKEARSTIPSSVFVQRLRKVDPNSELARQLSELPPTRMDPDDFDRHVERYRALGNSLSEPEHSAVAGISQILKTPWPKCSVLACSRFPPSC